MVVKSVSYFWVATVYIRVPLLMLSIMVDGSVGTVDVEAVAMVDATFVIAFIVEYILLI